MRYRRRPALSVMECSARAVSTENARVIAEKPFGTDLRVGARRSTHDSTRFRRVADLPHRPLPRQGVGRQHPRRSGSRNGLFEPIWNRDHIEPRPDRRARDHLDRRPRRVLRADRHVPRHGRDPPLPGARVRRDGAAHLVAAPTPCATRRSRSSTRCGPSTSPRSCAGQYEGYRSEPGVDPASQTETFVALRVEIDNWRWAGVPFYLRSGKSLGQRRQVVALGFRQPPLQMFPTMRTAPATGTATGSSSTSTTRAGSRRTSSPRSPGRRCASTTWR